MNAYAIQADIKLLVSIHWPNVMKDYPICPKRKGRDLQQNNMNFVVS